VLPTLVGVSVKPAQRWRPPAADACNYWRTEYRLRFPAAARFLVFSLGATPYSDAKG